MMQKQKGFSAPVLAMSVWTAALAEEIQTGISPRGMIIHGAVQALLLTCISGAAYECDPATVAVCSSALSVCRTRVWRLIPLRW